MARAFLLIRLTLVLVGSVAATVATAGGPPGDAGKPSGNTFNMLTVAPAPSGPRAAPPSAGASIAPKAVVRDPYRVPLLNNASSLRSGR